MATIKKTSMSLPGIFKLTFGKPEKFTPVTLRHTKPAVKELSSLPTISTAPFAVSNIRTVQSARGFRIELPLDAHEQVFGLGLQLLSFNQRGLKKTLRVNSDPVVDLGDSHAPVPFYVSTKGYGVLIDTARYATFYCGSTVKLTDRQSQEYDKAYMPEASIDNLYTAKHKKDDSVMLIDIPATHGVTIYIFAGPTMRDAIARYNLFSGGGCLPPRWGLGNWYRCKGNFEENQVVALGKGLRDDAIPCDVLGLEPGWQSHSYSCSHLWSERFKKPAHMLKGLAKLNFKVNSWTHAFTHPTSPIYKKLLPYGGEHEVFTKGLVPDFTIAAARTIFAKHYETTGVSLGISGYKLDECDGSDFIKAPWSFPETSRFPSGLDGEQMHSLFGMNFQEALYDIFKRRNRRTYSEVRNAHALAASYPFVLYSDLYNHQQFIRGVVNAGFSGLLWSPEVREAVSAEDLVRRIATTVCSPQSLINAWYIKNPPWKQWNVGKNNSDSFLPNAKTLTDLCRKFFELRMQLIPYLYSAFFQYRMKGIPPFRACVVDWPEDENLWKLDTQYMMGDSILVAPVTAGQKSREIYLPVGEWYDFWTNKKVTGGKTITRKTPVDIIPMYVKSGTVLPLAVPTLHTDDKRAFELNVRVYGDGALGAKLVEDDGVSFDYENGKINFVKLKYDAKSGEVLMERVGKNKVLRYVVRGVQKV